MVFLRFLKGNTSPPGDNFSAPTVTGSIIAHKKNKNILFLISPPNFQCVLAQIYILDILYKFWDK